MARKPQPRKSERLSLKRSDRTRQPPQRYSYENVIKQPIQKLIKTIKIAKKVNVSKNSETTQKIIKSNEKKAREILKSRQSFNEYYSKRGTNDITDQVEFTNVDINVSNNDEFFYLMAADIKHDLASLGNVTNPNEILSQVYKQNFGKLAKKPGWMSTNIKSLGGRGGKLEKDVQEKFKERFEKKYNPLKLSVSNVLNFDTYLKSKLFVAFDQASQGGISTHLFSKDYLNYIITPAQWMDAGRHLAPPQSQGGESFYYADKGFTFTIRTSSGNNVIFGGKITKTAMFNMNNVPGMYRVELTALFGQPLINNPKEFYVEGKGGAENNYLNKFFGDFAQILYCLAFKVKGRNINSPRLYWQTGDKIAQMMYLFMADSKGVEPALFQEIGQDSKTGKDRTLKLYMPKGGRQNIIRRNLEEFRTRTPTQPNKRVNYNSNNENKKLINPNFANSFRSELGKYFNKNPNQLTLRDVSQFAQKVSRTPSRNKNTFSLRRIFPGLFGKRANPNQN